MSVKEVILFSVALVLSIELGLFDMSSRSSGMVIGAEGSSVPMNSLAANDVAALKAVRSWLHDVDFNPVPATSFLSSWNFNADPCSFDGVLCDVVLGETRVASLTLGYASGSSAGLQGRLHPSLGSLSALLQLTLAPGKISGPIPSTLANLTRLQNLGLSHNLLTGTIPAEVAAIPNLVTLDLSFNRLSGPIPFRLAALPSLTTLRLAHNRLYGALPASFLGCPVLDHIDLSRNFFTGPLPILPPSLTHLDMSRNQLNGDLLSLLDLRDLSFLDLSRNRISGFLPAELLALPLMLLSLHHNTLSGIVSPDQLVTIPTVDLSFNQLSGPLSPLFAFTRNLYLSHNQFVGPVPQEYIDQLLSSSMHTLFLQHNFLTDFPNLPDGFSMPVSASVCVQYNCMHIPPLDSPCPPMRASRPFTQCKST
ncbi:hypothetical protein KP509_19G043000 [Ceratopteris richardii]|uniref:Leucine-rich repeat-containing N-terminal plant-type domain-containing protein n=1 Tax=Ceratopteris richardii TaxID=49495 RepID=A0A8T2SNK4_CERRI|nr:hypothetical protein KP509_19G043000 [Ceratopteris richardii]